MTAVTDAQLRRPLPRAARAVPLTLARLLRIELRASAMPMMLPVIAALLWFDSYRPSTAQPPVWVLRTFWNMGQGHAIIDFGPLVAGVAAWMGSRDARRGTTDLATTVPRPPWAAQLITWAATAIWAVGGYLIAVAILFGVYAAEGVQGSPPWWWVIVGAAAVAAFSAAGFAVGAYFPSRFAAPVAAFAGFFAMIMSSRTGFSHTTGWALILPTNANGNYQPVSGTYYPYLPDLPIARVMFLAGLGLAALGVIGLRGEAGGPWLRRVAAVVTLSGMAVAGTAVGLAGSARLGAHGMVIPALHDSASDRPIAYTPVCGRSAGVPVCLNPAYRRDLADVTAALRPVLREVAGLPGAPARVTEVAGTYSSREVESAQPMTISGHPPMLRIPLDEGNLPGAFGAVAAELSGQLRLLAVHAFTGAGASLGTPAQRAVQAALLRGAGAPFAEQPSMLHFYGLPSWPQVPKHARPDGPVYAAARRLAALPIAARRAWLTSHLAALRAGHLVLAQLP
jgi:hypothetical protein